MNPFPNELISSTRAVPPLPAESSVTTEIDKPVKMRMGCGRGESAAESNNEPLTIHEMFARNLKQGADVTALGMHHPYKGELLPSPIPNM